MSQVNQPIKFLHYRNGRYQGQTKQSRRHGKGILITDFGEVLIGDWKNDKIHGNAIIFISNSAGGEYGYGEFNRGELEGWFKFESNEKILIAEFNTNRPINKQLLIRKDQQVAKVVVPKHPIYQILKEKDLESSYELSEVIFGELGVKVNCVSITAYIKQYFENSQFFQLETLSNGYRIVRFNDESDPLSLGLVLNKSDQIVSYGTYGINNKLSGYGCKFENAPMTRYEGIFENGFLNGDGLKFNAGKYSFGRFENGTLVEPITLEERSPASEEKLVELKRLHHIKNLHFTNAYVNPKILKFRGTSEIIFEIFIKQDFSSSLFYHSSPEKQSSKQSNNLALKLINKESHKNLNDSDVKSNYSHKYRYRERQAEMEKKMSYSRNYGENGPHSPGLEKIGSLRKFNQN